MPYYYISYYYSIIIWFTYISVCLPTSLNIKEPDNPVPDILNPGRKLRR